MLGKNMHHPRQGRRVLDQAANFFLFIAGIGFLALGLAVGGGAVAKELTVIEGEPSWRAALMSFFFVLAASECFTANITRWSGEFMRMMAKKIADKVLGNGKNGH